LIGELISLLDTMDDLNAAASSIMNLLAKLLASNSAEKYIQFFLLFIKFYSFFCYLRFKLSFAQVLPKIFPFCRHHIVPFRLAAIETVMKIIEATQVKNKNNFLHHFFFLLINSSLN